MDRETATTDKKPDAAPTTSTTPDTTPDKDQTTYVSKTQNFGHLPYSLGDFISGKPGK
ncbi:MAG: hypothetical protein WCX71_03635 [Candidatus Buchananbacteria bacterium]